MIFQLKHQYSLLTDFFGIKTNLDQNELEKALFYIEQIHMDHMPNLPYVLDDSLSEMDVIELLPILYKDKNFTFEPIYQEPEQEVIVIDLWDIENGYPKFKPVFSEINEKYATANATLTLMEFYQSEAKASLKKEYVINNKTYQSIDENTKNYNREVGILQKILQGEEIQAEWNVTSFTQKKLTGMKFIHSKEKEIIAF